MNQPADDNHLEREAQGQLTRRSLLRRAAAGLSGVAVVILTGEEAYVWGSAFQEAPQGAPAPVSYDPTKHHYVYLVDIDKCIGCGSCVRACERENQVPSGYFRTWIERYHISRTGNEVIDSPNGGRDGFEALVTGELVTKSFFVPKLCNHCSLTPCVQLCPVGASYRTPDNLILVDEQRCIGCSYCVQACPYGSRFIHPETHTASKCTLCYHRITKGLLTACIQACPRGVRKLGDTVKADDEVSEIIATRHVHVLKPELLTDPNCYYLGLSHEVR